MGLADRVKASVLTPLKANLHAMKGCSRELYVIYVLKALESYGYFSISLLYTLYLTNDFGMDDFKAGTSYGIWGTCLTAWGVALGPAIDNLGVRRSLMLNFVISSLARFALANTTRLGIALTLLYGPIGAASALGVPVMTIGVKRGSPPAARGIAFAFYYSVMNCAALLCGVMIQSFLAAHLHGFERKDLPCDHMLNDGYRLLIVSSSITSAIGLLISAFMLHDKPASSFDDDLAGKETDSDGAALPSPRTAGGGWAGMVARTHAVLDRSWRSLKEVASTKELRKFVVVCLLTVNIKQIFRHLDATLPKFQIRAFTAQLGEQDAIRLVGRSYSVNPFLIIILVPIVGALTAHFEHFDMLHYGSYVSALSPMFMVFTQAPWTTYAFVAMLSLGEAVWSPRWYDYSMAVAPHGREGIYTALSAAPLFLAKLPTGMLSGALLMHFCPASSSAPTHTDASGEPLCLVDSTPAASAAAEAGRKLMEAAPKLLRRLLDAAQDAASCHGQPMWAIITVISLSSPLALLVFGRWLRPAKQTDYDHMKDSDAPAVTLEAHPFLLRDPAPLGVMPLEPPHGSMPFGSTRTWQSSPYSGRAAAAAPAVDDDVINHHPEVDLPAWRPNRRSMMANIPGPLASDDRA